jgi:nicotinamide-nucleotide amidase
MQAAILAIGDELVLGQTVDRNSAWLSARLAELGILTRYHQTVSDDLAEITRAITDAAAAAELVLITGGLGPTADDLTRQALADAMGSPLIEDAESLQQIEAYFAARGRSLPERNKVQALRPEAARPVLNDAGTAPGIDAKLGQARVFVTPGVPREMRRMWEQTIAPALTPKPGERGVIRTLKLNTFGHGESDVAEAIEDLMQRDGNPTVGTTISDGIVAIRLRAQYPTPEEANRALQQTARTIEDRLVPIAFGRDDQTLPQVLLSLLTERELTLATAESCTGGLLGAMVTAVPGSSAVYHGGWVTYTNAMKTQQLGVPETVLQSHGAVSAPVVRQLARSAAEQTGADLGVAISGVAGPSGGTDAKPVGTIWIGLAWRARSSDNSAGQAIETAAMHFQLPGNREAIRDRAAKCALQMVRLHVLGEPLTHMRWGTVAEPETQTS